MTPKEAYKKSLKEKIITLELEEIICNNLQYSYEYARDVIKRPWKKGEKIISKSAKYFYWYARYIIKERWKRCEKSVSIDPYYCYIYASDVIKGAFKRGHSIIFNSKYKSDYLHFLKKINYDMNIISEWLI